MADKSEIKNWWQKYMAAFSILSLNMDLFYSLFLQNGG